MKTTTKTYRLNHWTVTVASSHIALTDRLISVFSERAALATLKRVAKTNPELVQVGGAL